jgi:NADH dehydrogenase [ubiquinone] 1 alpha subcomplex assembly factor 2
VRVPPQWHQWLRYRREEPPSLAEQAADVARQERIKALAAEADARWEARPRLTDEIAANKNKTTAPPAREHAAQEQDMAAEAVAAPSGSRSVSDVENGHGASRTKTATTPKPELEHDPWKKASGPSETWQPEAWTPTSAKRR